MAETDTEMHAGCGGEHWREKGELAEQAVQELQAEQAASQPQPKCHTLPVIPLHCASCVLALLAESRAIHISDCRSARWNSYNPAFGYSSGRGRGSSGRGERGRKTKRGQDPHAEEPEGSMQVAAACAQAPRLPTQEPARLPRLEASVDVLTCAPLATGVSCSDYECTLIRLIASRVDARARAHTHALTRTHARTHTCMAGNADGDSRAGRRTDFCHTNRHTCPGMMRVCM